MFNQNLLTQQQLIVLGRKISDYALIFALTGLLLMIIETEFSMSKLYNKVNFREFRIQVLNYNLYNIFAINRVQSIQSSLKV